MSLSAWLVTLPQWLSVLLVVGSFVLFSVGMILIVRRGLPTSALKPHNTTTGLVYSAVAAIYGVVLAFVVVEVWSQHTSAQRIADQECSEAYSLYRDLNLYPKREEADKTLAALRVFTLSVVRDEYPAIKAMKWDSKYQPSSTTHKAINDLLATIRQIVPRNLHEQSLFNEILKHANDMAQERVKRGLSAQSDLPGVLWIVLVLGGLITQGFVALLGHEDVRQHILLGVLLALVMSTVVYVIVILNFPFSGEVGINPDGYKYLIEQAGWS